MAGPTSLACLTTTSNNNHVTHVNLQPKTSRELLDCNIPTLREVCRRPISSDVPLSTMADDAIQSLLESYTQSETTPAASIPTNAHCCCGNPACAYLRQNARALEGLEKDVTTAAKLGKVCEFGRVCSWRL